MKRIKVLALVMAIVVPVLTSCELFYMFEDFVWGDPMGLGGEGVDVGVGGGALFALIPMADGTGTVTATFEDVPDLPPLLPTSISFEQPLATTATLTGTSDYPNTIDLSDVRLSVHIWDSQNSLTLNFPAHGSAVLNHLGDGEYSMSNIDFSIDMTGSTMLAVHAIISDGGTNYIEADISLTATSDPDLPSGAVISMTFGGGQGTVEF